MAFKLNIVDKKQGLNFNVKYSNLAKAKRPEIAAKNSKGETVKEKMVVVKDGQVLQGDLGRKWLDDKGNEYGKTELTFWFKNEQVIENQQTKVMEIEGYQALDNYTDKYVISTYYELEPAHNDMKKDRDREIARSSNLYQMRKLWDYLNENKVVARGEFCSSSRGFVASDGYIRAIKVNGTKWGLEIGVFKEEKIFEHLQEHVPQQVDPVVIPTGRKRIKNI